MGGAEPAPAVTGGFVERDGCTWYRIRGVDLLPPFLTSVASGSDHWLFASSRGPLTAGRRDVHSALFPYRTEDALHDAVGRVGSRTLVAVDGHPIWEPGTDRDASQGRGTDEAWKDTAGTAVAFEHRHPELDLVLRITWTFSDRFGVVRFAELRNEGRERIDARIVDGLTHLLPALVDPGMQTNLSCLVDAYKSCYAVGDRGLAAFALSSVPVDRAEPSEALAATTVWTAGYDPSAVMLLSEQQIDGIRRGAESAPEPRARGRRCAYLLDRRVSVEAGASLRWATVCEVDQDAASILSLADFIATEPDPLAAVVADVAVSRARLLEVLARADSEQSSGNPALDARHRSNVLYNVMRGGIPLAGHDQRRDAIRAHVRAAAPRVADRVADALARLPEEGSVSDFAAAVRSSGDPDLVRLHRDYLPLSLSRRHGDPSRPWNKFSIQVRNADGSPRTGYEGNWRDIFQNWEALGLSHPAYLPGFIGRFVDSSTADGFNPYRIHTHGIDWEVEEPDDPWSFIGYWGDHQIVYLTRLLERCEERWPGRIGAWLGEATFVHADVPYRIRGFDALVADPSHTVDFDHTAAAIVAARTASDGEEGKLVVDADGQLVRVTLAEKLLVPLLVKLTSFVPGAGVWLNTQRPEWNDANNALVGRGASIVTTCALLRHTEVLAGLFGDESDPELSAAAVTLFADTAAVLDAHDPAAATTDSGLRAAFLDAVGRVGERHRAAVYARLGLQPEVRVSASRVRAFLVRASEWLSATVTASRREDGLYHAYNLLEFEGATRIGIRRLPAMLEGQVAVLAAGRLGIEDSLALLGALRASPLRCPRRRGYLLYPDRELPTLLERNLLPADLAARWPAVSAWLDGSDPSSLRDVVRSDAGGNWRFAPNIRNRAELDRALSTLPAGLCAASVAADLADVHEAVFDHAAFTGRSGTFFGYEGLGCIYWHMVSKLAVAVQETVWRAVDHGAPREQIDALVSSYVEIRESLGAESEPADWGAFPIDAYSHTPGQGGARQPGMTGQVKEDVLCRLGELGVRCVGGRLGFDPTFRRTWGVGDAPRFTICGTQVTYALGADPSITVVGRDGALQSIEGAWLDEGTSRDVLDRSGAVEELRVVLAGSH